MNEHARADALIPWLVNGRLQGAELAWLEQHLAGCAACRAEHAVQQQVCTALTRDDEVTFAPQPSFNRLWERIQAGAARPSAPLPRPASHAPERAARRPPPPRRWLAVAVTLQALVIGVLTAWLWQLHTTPSYRTVTTAAADSGRAASVHALFDDRLRLAEFHDLLARAGLRVISGPTPAGVYTLTAEPGGTRTLEAAVAELRRSPRVRFAEISEP
jgi:anti-sigma factor RsiW